VTEHVGLQRKQRDQQQDPVDADRQPRSGDAGAAVRRERDAAGEGDER
jgi:hypothetical protein